jgi:ABC-type phosphate transport system permease subunit
MRPFLAVLPPVIAFSLGMVLAIMISISEEVFRAVPFEIREASFAIGATKMTDHEARCNV